VHAVAIVKSDHTTAVRMRVLCVEDSRQQRWVSQFAGRARGGGRGVAGVGDSG
jgi:hypothetical protein